MLRREEEGQLEKIKMLCLPKGRNKEKQNTGEYPIKAGKNFGKTKCFCYF